MNTNTDHALVEILNRLRTAPEHERPSVTQELIDALDADQNSPEAQAANLRNALEWPEIKGNALATARICRTLRALRDKI